MKNKNKIAEFLQGLLKEVSTDNNKKDTVKLTTYLLLIKPVKTFSIRLRYPKQYNKNT